MRPQDEAGTRENLAKRFTQNFGLDAGSVNSSASPSQCNSIRHCSCADSLGNYSLFIASEAINGNARSGSLVGLMRSKNRAPETSAAFFYAQVKIESEPKPDHAQYFVLLPLKERQESDL